MQFLVCVRSYCILYFVLLFSHAPTFHFDTLISFKVYTILKCLHLPQKCLLYLVCSNTVELERPFFLGVKSVSVVPSCICYCFSVAQSRLFVTPWTAACQTFLSFTISQNLLRLMSMELMMPSNHLILCQPLHLLPSIFPSIRVFSNESVLPIRWPKY